MGKGLNIPSSGRTVAFTAGTGILVFVDLVAHLLLRVMFQKLGQPWLKELDDSDIKDLSKFSFELYSAFPNENESIAYELIDQAEETNI